MKHVRIHVQLAGIALAASALAAAIASPARAATMAAPSSVLGAGDLLKLSRLKAGQQAVLSPDLAYTFTSVVRDPDGSVHTRLQQVHKGAAVAQGEIILHAYPTGRVRVSGEVVQGVAADMLARQDGWPQRQQWAIQRAGEHLKSKGFVAGGHPLPQVAAATPVIHVLNGVAKMAISVKFKPQADLHAPVVSRLVIGESDGQVLLEESGINHVQKGTGPSGNEKTGLKEYGSGGLGFLDITEYAAEGRCALDTPDYLTFDAKMVSGVLYNRPPAISFPCGPATGYRQVDRPISGGFGPANDAHYFVGKTIEMFQSLIGRKPYSKKFKVATYSTYEMNLGCGAGWMIDYDTLVVGYGDYRSSGDQVCFGTQERRYPFAVADVIGHEVTHAYVADTSKLPQSGIGGALNESFADFGGVALEYKLYGKTDWAVGTEVIKGSNVPMRYVDQPSRDGSPEHVNQYVEANGPHRNAGIFNRAFYLLSTKPGWNTQKVFKVLARASANEWTSSVDFKGAACGVLEATNDLEFNVNDAVNALAATGLTCSTPPVVATAMVGGYAISTSTVLNARVGGVAVTLIGTRGTFSATTRSDGLFTVPVPSGTYLVSGLKSGYTFTPVQLEVPDTANSVTAPNLNGKTSLAVTGRLRDGSQSSTSPNYYLAGMPVSLYSGTVLVSTLKTDAYGVYEFAPLTNGATYSLQFNQAGWQSVFAVTSPVTAAPQLVSLTTAPQGSARVSGKLVTSAGVPIQGAWLTLQPCGERSLYKLATNASGSFTFSFTPTASVGAPDCPLGQSNLLVVVSQQVRQVANQSSGIVITDEAPY